MQLTDGENLQNVVLQAPIGICILHAATLITEIVNDKFLEIAGKSKEAVLGKYYWEPFADGRSVYEPLLEKVIKTGERFYADEVQLTLVRHSREEMVFVTFVYDAVKDEHGAVNKVAIWVLEHTHQVRSRQKLEAAKTALQKERDRFKTFFMQAPAGICILSGPELVYELVNPGYQQLMPGRTLLNRPIFEAIPELVGTPLQDVLLKVYRTGNPYNIKELQVPIAKYEGGPPEDRYFSFNYEARRDENDNVDGILVFVFEVTDAVRSQQALKQSNELLDQQKRVYETIASSTPDLMYVFGLDYRFTYANRALLTMWGKSYENAVGKSLLENGYEPWHAEMHEREIDRIVANKTPVRGEVAFPHATLGRRIYDYILNPVINEQGEVEAVAGTTRDVTERKRWEESLAQTSEELQAVNEEQAAANEELISTNDQLYETKQALEATIKQLASSRGRFQNLVREADIGIIVLIGDEMRVEIVNKNYSKLIDRNVDELVGKKLFDIIPETEPVFRPIIEKVRITGETLNLYDTPFFVYSSGEKIEGYLNLVYQPYIEDDRSITGVIILCQDVTEQVQAKINLENAYEQLRLSREAAELGFFDMDMLKGTMEWDARCRELFGISHKDTVTYEKDFITGLHPDDKERVLAVINNVFNKSVSNGVYDVAYRTIGAEDKQLRWVRAKGQAYFDNDDKPVRFIGSVIDITEQKQDEIRKNDFIGMASHELKTPLTSLSAIIQMANSKLKSSNDPFLSTAMEKAGMQVKRMGNMINGFLNISRLESAKLLIDKQHFDIEVLIDEIINETRLTVASHSIEFQHHNNVSIDADRDKIGSVIMNLLSNAIKYSRKGTTIRVKCEVKDNMVQVSVTDDGIGLKPQDIGKVFERYFRAENFNTRNISGFGIGLYLSAEIVHRHDGKIWVESEAEKGSTFYFSLPL